ncbi:MAG: preprotein translocase subunit SecE [Candidatus Sungbacteria bacterium RIFCSPHIGHO2_01_FULL_50_25]|uniref:Protein translocase subunit SecE n=1 Tax=Candidatus Sungbacteria bacterium RIFCSPHIGHO2_01_FULL_50_25 TaxID=1802265 RepID=A0A1G2KA52_9BACT|nr:MAG: preprotein translocase subunit SecE [Candidatus Sungbacteria bacterium RIFCSPHIGHO2_01_FULL_50_25]
MNRFTVFLKEANVELKKVTWPTRQETVRSTIAVIILSAVVAFFLGFLDFGFQFILDKFVL